jgi:O-antigen/teichoic acid export membrane protein
MPMIGLMLVTADKLILLLLGEQWLGVVPLFQLLMPAAFNATIGVALGWAYQSLGTVDRQLRWGIASSIVNVLLFAVGVRWGALGVAAAYGLTRPAFLIAGFAYCFHNTPLKLIELAKTLAHPAIASTSASLIIFGMNLFIFTEMNLLATLLLDCVLYVLCFIGIWMILPYGRQSLSQVSSAIKEIQKKRSDN